MVESTQNPDNKQKQGIIKAGKILKEQEKRRSIRRETPYTALCCTDIGVRAVHIKDLSTSGAGIVFNEPIVLTPGETVILHFYAKEIQRLVSKLKCRVVRTFDDNGKLAAGLKFVRIRNTGVNKVVRWLYWANDSRGEVIETSNERLWTA